MIEEANAKSLIIFDLDGTLINSLTDIADSVNYALKKNGLSTYSEEIIMTFVGNGAMSLLKKAATDFENDSEKMDIIFEDYMSHYFSNCTNKSTPYNFALEFINKLKKEGFLLAVLSNKPDVFTQKCVDFYFEKNTFDYVIGSDSRWERKPEPDGLFLVADELKRDLSDCIYVGDSRGDALAAKAAEMRFVWVNWGYQNLENLEGLSIENIASDFDELYQIIHTLSSPVFSVGTP